MKGKGDPVYSKLAHRFNQLSEGRKLPCGYVSPETYRVQDSLWILEFANDLEGGTEEYQGTGFDLSGKDIVTCAHVVIDESGNPARKLIGYRADFSWQKVPMRVVRFCQRLDLAILRPSGAALVPGGKLRFNLSKNNPAVGDQLTAYGFPSYSPGNQHTRLTCLVTSEYVLSKSNRFEVDQTLRSGISGGPLLNSVGEVVGMAQKGATQASGKNMCLPASGVRSFIGRGSVDTQ